MKLFCGDCQAVIATCKNGYWAFHPVAVVFKNHHWVCTNCNALVPFDIRERLKQAEPTLQVMAEMQEASKT